MHQSVDRGRHRRVPQHQARRATTSSTCGAQMITLARENGLLLAAGATHPFADWRDAGHLPRRALPAGRRGHADWWRASNLIFGLHVHVGIEDRETGIHLMNQVRYFLPHLLALSTNSPFWLGMNTGLQVVPLQGLRQVPAHRTSRTRSRAGPTTRTRQPADPDQLHRQRQEDLVGHPPASVLLDARSAASATCRCAWTRRSRIAALIQATIAKLYKLHSRNQGFRMYSRALIMENKWRAARYGLDGKLIDFGREKEVPDARADPRDPRLRRRRGRRARAAAKEVEYVQTHPRARHRRRPPARRCFRRRPATSKQRRCEYMVAETQAGPVSSGSPPQRRCEWLSKRTNAR